MKQQNFDAHFHIIDPRFPLVPNAGYLPGAYRVEDYLSEVAPLGITGGAVVSGSFQAFDQDYLLHALDRLGPGFCGVTQLSADVTDSEIMHLNEKGVKAVRFNLKRGGSESVEHLESFARRVHDLAAWHVELYMDGRELAGLGALLLRLPAVSIDHLGLSAEGLPALLRLAEKGVRVKATGFGRVGMPVSETLQAIYAVNPHVLMFGTDLPSTRARRRFGPDDLALVTDALGETAARKVLWENALSFYRLSPGQ